MTEFIDKNVKGNSSWQLIPNRNSVSYKGLELVPTEDVDRIIEQNYNKSYLGRDKLYYKIKQKYVGISFRDVNNYLLREESHQIQRELNQHQPVRSITATIPNKRWQIDLKQTKYAELNEGVEFLLVCIDIYSRYVWVEGLTNKLQSTVIKAFKKILRNSFEMIGSYPKIVQSDNGSEFTAIQWKDVRAKYGFKQVFSKAHTPTSQAIVERFNRVIGSMINRHLSQTKNLIYFNQLDGWIKNYNMTYHSTIKTTPYKAYNSMVNKQFVNKNVRKQTKKLIQKTQRQFPQIQKGDLVRVIRSREHVQSVRKGVAKTNLLGNWSRRIYKVSSVSKPKDIASSRPVYTVVHTSNNKFYGRYPRHELLLAKSD